MAQIFISYSRADTLFVEQLIPLLEEVFKQHTFWYDQHIDGGDLWWEKILTAINESSVFIFLLSHDSLTSDYCQAEFREALRLNIPFLPVIVRSKTNVEDAPPDLQENIKERNWIDLSNGFKDAKANARLYSALNQILTQAVQLPTEPINPQPTPKPNVTSKPVIVRASLRRDPAIIAALIGAVAVIIGAIITVGPQFLNQVTPLPTFTPTTLAQVPTPHATNTALPTLDIAFVVATLDAQATIDQASLNARSTIGARITEDAVGTQSITNQTATAAQRTLTPTANVTASIEAYRTQQGQTATAQTIVNLTGTASAWTSTPTVTKTPVPSLTPTQTYTPTAILTNTSTPTATLTLPPEQIALTPIKLNADWIPIESYFDGVMMVLVPAGCFIMGSNEGNNDELPIHKQCFSQPFWIDKYEVYNRQFELLNGVSDALSNWTGGKRPREMVTWFEASNFCVKRGARLPTEREWEYAARGPTALNYPWGNSWISDAFFLGHADEQTVDIGSYPAGASWVGAEDMSGNVWEYTSTIYGIESGYDYDLSDPSDIVFGYPYIANDGREENSDNILYYRVLRGGAWSVGTEFTLRGASRGWYGPDQTVNDIGFRCVRS